MTSVSNKNTRSAQYRHMGMIFMVSFGHITLGTEGTLGWMDDAKPNGGYRKARQGLTQRGTVADQETVEKWTSKVIEAVIWKRPTIMQQLPDEQCACDHPSSHEGYWSRMAPQRQDLGAGLWHTDLGAGGLMPKN